MSKPTKHNGKIPHTEIFHAETYLKYLHKVTFSLCVYKHNFVSGLGSYFQATLLTYT